MFKNKPKLTVRCKSTNFFDLYIDTAVTPEKKMKMIILHLSDKFPQFDFFYCVDEETNCTIIQGDRRIKHNNLKYGEDLING